MARDAALAVACGTGARFVRPAETAGTAFDGVAGLESRFGDTMAGLGTVVATVRVSARGLY